MKTVTNRIHYTTTDRTISALREAARAAQDYKADWALDAIAWYVLTDRAPTSWVLALYKANPKKLIAHVMRASNESTSGMVKAATRYLVRYCGLTEIPNPTR